MYGPWVAPFLVALASEGAISRAARRAGISSSTVHALRKADEDFAEACRLALEDAYDDVEAVQLQRAKGLEELVVYQGQLTPVWARDEHGQILHEEYDDPSQKSGKNKRPVQERLADGSLRWLTVTKHSDAAAALILKGRRKKVFAERTEITGADGGPVVLDDATRRARIASILAKAEAREGLA